MAYFRTILTLLLLLLLTANLWAQQMTKDTLRFKKNPTYDLQMKMFDAYKTRQADIVMLGNSHTAGVNWSELLGKINVVGRGIPGDIIIGYYARLNTIFKLNPKIVFVMGGLNDIYNWTPVEEIFSDFVKIINSLKLHNIIPVIQSTTYAGRDWGKEWGVTPEMNLGRNKEIDKLNRLLSDYAKRNNIDYIDLNSLVAGKDGYLRPELTYDGLHFNAAAYRIWAREVERVLNKYKF